MSGENDPAAGENKASAAFEEYRMRMDAQAANAPPGFPPMMPGWLPPPPGYVPHGPPPGHVPQGPPQGYVPQGPPGHPGYGPMPPPTPGPGSGYHGRTDSLVEALGNLVRVGVDAINVGLAGGVQLVQGLTGPPMYGQTPWIYGYPYHGHQSWYGGYSCCGAGYPEWGCHSGVWGCY